MGLFSKPETPNERGGRREIEELRALLGSSRIPQHALALLERELEVMARISPSAVEFSIGLTYINYIASLPWGVLTEDSLEMAHVRAQLDARHYGLRRAKERIIEHLAVMILKRGQAPKLLVVDDDAAARRNLSHALAHEGYTVDTADSGEEAAALIEAGEYDLVLSDIKMQGLDGITLLERVRRLEHPPRVILITGYASVEAAVRSMKMGAFSYIQKPYQLDAIRATVAEALKARSPLLGIRGPVLCFAGPPGTGKTSLGMAVAEAMGRRFARISLGGVRDEAEIRGHRRTYAGAQPGRLVEEIRRLGCLNPVIMLDEMDKLGDDFKGDPASALLEVLDPEQNARFIDHYVDIPFDLSNVMFIATANVAERIPPALRDRMEAVEFTGYSEHEKVRIALDYLVPRHTRELGLSPVAPAFTEQAVLAIIQEYTREAGIRELKRQIATILRKLAVKAVEGVPAEAGSVRVDAPDVAAFLGPRRYYYDVVPSSWGPGTATGLVWTETGGNIMFVETARMKGSGDLTLTGSLGTVMQESARAALSYVRSNAPALGVDGEFFEGHDIHIHVPAGSVPKDGPSAGAVVAVALVSLLTGRPARTDMGITGELTLSGRLLPVAGIKEKLLAARRAGLACVALPAENRVELENMPPEVLHGLTVECFDSAAALIARALSG